MATPPQALFLIRTTLTAPPISSKPLPPTTNFPRRSKAPFFLHTRSKPDTETPKSRKKIDTLHYPKTRPPTPSENNYQGSSNSQP
ncbi:hypothetical protein CCACVL1_14979 [Corchorus capsularis]|uniref:Uncharacterized protein n=1 Tax=Corchorus capsularis TaxID=210143 RepID=A0A1R3I4M8_COCAP|nr:hypothetical protein CCACVL1_14979 [Corchorus capsularis]